MLKHINKLSKDNYKCKYYDSNNIQSLIKLHQKSALKAFHVNISSIAKNGLDLTCYLEELKITFDIIMLTETRETSPGYIEFLFPDHDIFLDNPKTLKGGACIIVRKNKFENVKQINNNTLNLKNKCNCSQCEIDNVWISLKLNKKDVIIGCIYRHPKADIGIHSAAFLCYFFHKISASGSKFFIMYFFALISNPESELKNLRRVFFYFHFNFYISNCELTK